MKTKKLTIDRCNMCTYLKSFQNENNVSTVYDFPTTSYCCRNMNGRLVRELTRDNSNYITLEIPDWCPLEDGK